MNLPNHIARNSCKVSSSLQSLFLPVFHQLEVFIKHLQETSATHHDVMSAYLFLPNGSFLIYHPPIGEQEVLLCALSYCLHNKWVERDVICSSSGKLWSKEVNVLKLKFYFTESDLQVQNSCHNYRHFKHHFIVI